MGLLPAGLRNNPFRVLPWFVFHAGLAAVTGPWRPAPRLRVAIAIGGLALLAWHVRNLDVAFYTYAFKPYPALDGEVRAALAPDGGPVRRGLACSAMRSIDPRLPAALPHNLNAAHGVPMFYGYDPVMQSHMRFLRCLARLEADPKATLQAYGVSHLLVHRTLYPGRVPESGNRFESVFPLCDAIAPSGLIDPALAFAGDAAVAVVPVPGAAAIAFAADRPHEPLPLMLRGDGLDVDCRGLAADSAVVLNFLWWPALTARGDDRPLTVESDDWDRVVVRVPAGTARLAMRYRPPWPAGLAAGGGLAAAAALLAWALGRRPDPVVPPGSGGRDSRHPH
jgi:hypothetical protein